MVKVGISFYTAEKSVHISIAVFSFVFALFCWFINYGHPVFDDHQKFPDLQDNKMFVLSLYPSLESAKNQSF